MGVLVDRSERARWPTIVVCRGGINPLRARRNPCVAAMEAGEWACSVLQSDKFEVQTRS